MHSPKISYAQATYACFWIHVNKQNIYSTVMGIIRVSDSSTFRNVETKQCLAIQKI